MRRVLFLPSKPNKRAGGPTGYVGYLQTGLEALSVNNIDIKYPLAGHDARNTERIIARKIYNFGKDVVKAYLPSLWIAMKKQRYLQHARKFADFVEKVLAEATYSLAHFHGTSDFFAFVQFGTKKNRQTLTILTSHSPVPPHKELTYYLLQGMDLYGSKRLISSNTKSTLLGKVEKFYETIDLQAFEQADYLVFPCEEALEGYLKWAPFENIISTKKVAYVLSGVESMSFKLTPDEVREKYSIPRNAFIVSYVGRHDSFKGYDILQQAAEWVWKKNKNIWFLIGGKEWPIKGLHNDNWIEVGWTDDPGSLINASDVFVLPNRETFFDLILLEVLSLGKPVLASRTGGNKYVARQSEGVILFDLHPEDLGEKLLQLATERDFLAKVGQMNKATYEKYYTVELFAKRYVELYDSIEREA